MIQLFYYNDEILYRYKLFVYLAIDDDTLSRDVLSLLEKPDTLLYINAGSVQELIVEYNNKGLCSKRWKSAGMIVVIEEEFHIKILPLKKEHMITYAGLELNEL